MPHLEITTLGAIQASLDGQRLASFGTDKVRALLVFLAVEAYHPHRREALAGMFWADRPTAAARNNLRQALYRLRESIHDQGSGSPCLLVTANEIQFNPGCDYWLDVDQFSAHLAAYLAHHPGGLSLCQGCLEGLCAAVGLYGGDFLAGFSLPDCPQFEWWLLTQQELYHHQVLEALASLGSYYESCGDYHQACSYAQKEIEIEPWRETAHRRRMHALALSGERNEALRQYESCRAILARELGVEPSLETVRLYKRVRDGRLNSGTLKATVHIPEAVEALTSSVTGTFVAREAELARLETCLAAALAGQGRVVFVTGEAGSGKTSLIGEFARRSLQAQEGLLAAGGSCNAYAGRGNAYLPFVECLRMLSGDVEASQVSCLFSEELLQHQWAASPAVLQSLLEAGPDLVGTLLPGQALLQHARAAAGADDSWLGQLESLLASAPGDQPPDSPGAGSASLNQADLFDQVTQVLQTLSRRHALILALDDLQWADQASLNLLFHLGRRLTGSRILLICAYRPEDVALGREGARHPLEPLVNELQALFGERPVDLSKADGRAFVDALVDSEPNVLGAGFRHTLAHHTSGHPLFTVDLLRGLQERGELVKDRQGRWTAGAALNWETLPTRVEAVIAERLGRLAPESEALLAAASVQGETFTAEVLARAVGMEVAQVGGRLSGELSRQHRLVRALGRRRSSSQSQSRYCFRHFLYQLYLYQNLDEVERARLHQVTGEALETLTEDHSGEAAIAQA
ncbi:MAG: AAA family ATPase, partial [Gammaproteobacteria bacterium]|nr:AAA family ATPase [Gammaproteobacteria bacterium]